MAQRPNRGNTAIAMGVLAASFGAFYYTLYANREEKKDSGHLPQYEFTLSDQKKYQDSIPTNTSTASERTLGLVTHEHSSQHVPRDSLEGSSPSRYFKEPFPQPLKGGGSGLVSTKRADEKKIENPRQ